MTPDATIKIEEAIIRRLPGIPKEATIELNDNGYDSRAYSVNNDQYFVKFPRNEKIKGRYSYQISAQKLAFEIDSDITIPKILWQAADNSYFGYKGIQGVSLTETFETLDDAQKQAIGQSLGNFLRQFHRLKLPEARLMSIEQEVRQLQNWHEKGLPFSKEFFTTQEQARLHELIYSIWPNQLTELGCTSALCHGDLHFDNIFYDSGKVGIIDFGDACNADHSKDFADIYDETILTAMIKAYDNSDKKLLEKIRLRETTTRIITMTAQFLKNNKVAAQDTASKIRCQL